jgi:hypothetical protein
MSTADINTPEEAEEAFKAQVNYAQDVKEGKLVALPAHLAAQDVRDRVPDYIDLDEQDEELGGRTVKVMGSEMRIHPILVGASRKMGWYQSRITALTAEMNTQTEEKTALKIEERLREMQEKLTITLIPDFPIGILDSMPLGKYKRLMDVLNKIVEQDMGDANEGNAQEQNPNA